MFVMRLRCQLRGASTFMSYLTTTSASFALYILRAQMKCSIEGRCQYLHETASVESVGEDKSDVAAETTGGQSIQIDE